MMLMKQGRPRAKGISLTLGQKPHTHQAKRETPALTLTLEGKRSYRSVPKFCSIGHTGWS